MGCEYITAHCVLLLLVNGHRIYYCCRYNGRVLNLKRRFVYMTLKRILATATTLLLLTAGLLAEDNLPPTGLIVRTQPPGAVATVSGELTVSGVTPVLFQQPLIGDYKLTLKRYGYETYKTHLVLDPSKQMTLDVTLSPKTRFKAVVRSLFIPGWGQRYTEQKTKGGLLTAMIVGTGVAYLFADHRFDDRYDTYLYRLRRYDSLAVHGTVEELRSAKQELDKAQDKAYDAENIRRATIGVAIGIWVVNVLDLLFFFPEEHSTFSVKGVTITPSASLKDGSVGITLTKGF